MSQETAWMEPPEGGFPKEVAADEKTLVPLMVKGWRQVPPPKLDQEYAAENHTAPQP